MRIILSPAKKMNVDTDKLECQGLPVFIDQTEEILEWLCNKSHSELQELWGSRLYDEVSDGTSVIINLASKEYSKCIEKYLKPDDCYITITFGEMVNGKLVTKGTYAKMARGEMVKYMAENQIEDPNEIKKFDRLGHVYRDDLSCDTEIVFEKRK